jgi:hypothetical protein
LLSKVSFRGKADVFVQEFGHGDEVAQDAGLKDPALRLNLNANPRNAQKYGRRLHGRSKRKGKSLCGQHQACPCSDRRGAGVHFPLVFRKIST